MVVAFLSRNVKGKWAECFMKNAFTLGMSSTQLSESLNRDGEQRDLLGELSSDGGSARVGSRWRGHGGDLPATGGWTRKGMEAVGAGRARIIGDGEEAEKRGIFQGGSAGLGRERLGGARRQRLESSVSWEEEKIIKHGKH
jgi:hypothetical protein